MDPGGSAVGRDVGLIFAERRKGGVRLVAVTTTGLVLARGLVAVIHLGSGHDVPFLADGASIRQGCRLLC